MGWIVGRGEATRYRLDRLGARVTSPRFLCYAMKRGLGDDRAASYPRNYCACRTHN